MRANLKLGRIRGVTVGVHWSVLVVLAIVAFSLATARWPDEVDDYSSGVYWLAALVTATLFLVSILIHELSHSLVALRQGIAVDSITLWLLGGISQLKGAAKSPGDEFKIAVAGPLSSLAIGIVSGVAAFALDAANASPLVVALLAWLCGVNILLAVFNLVPAAPLDGGRVLLAAVWAVTKDRLRATRIAATAGQVFGGVLIALGTVLFIQYGDGLWFVLLGWFIINAAAAEEQQALMEQSLGSFSVGDVMSANPVTAPAGISVERFVDDYILRTRYTAFPLVDARGRVRGLLTLRRVKELPRERWRDTPVDEVACPIDEVPIARPDEPLVTAIERMDDGCSEGRLLVFDDAHLVGILSPSDVRRAFELTQALRPGHRVPQYE